MHGLGVTRVDSTVTDLFQILSFFPIHSHPRGGLFLHKIKSRSPTLNRVTIQNTACGPQSPALESRTHTREHRLHTYSGEKGREPAPWVRGVRAPPHRKFSTYTRSQLPEQEALLTLSTGPECQPT